MSESVVTPLVCRTHIIKANSSQKNCQSKKQISEMKKENLVYENPLCAIIK